MKRTEHLHMRLTKAEKAMLVEKAEREGLAITDYVRWKVLGIKPPAS